MEKLIRRSTATTHSVFFVVMFFTLAASSTAQQVRKFNVDLKINDDVAQFSGNSIASRKTGGDLTYTFPTDSGLGQAPGNVLVKIREMGGPLHAYQIWVDSNGDGDLVNIDRVAVDGSSVTLATTTLRVPVVSQLLPTFSLRTLDGTTIESKSLRNKLHLIDFWASWCKPCVEKFSLVERLSADFKDSLSIIAINVDESSRLPLAREIIKEKQLRWPHVMDGLGESDPMWKVFGAIGGNRLAIPLYVLVDVEGRIRYAGNGGEDLSDLRLEIENLLKRVEKK